MKSFIYFLFCLSLAVVFLSFVVFFVSPFILYPTAEACFLLIVSLMVTFPVFLFTVGSEEFDVYEMMEKDILF